jgi:hypothetical protein
MTRPEALSFCNFTLLLRNIDPRIQTNSCQPAGEPQIDFEESRRLRSQGTAR